MAKQQATVLGIDVARSFQQVMVVAVQPRMKFQSDEQDSTKDGRLKWDVQLSVTVNGPFGDQYSMLKVGVLGDEPQVTPGSLVELVGFQVGLMPDAAPWFRADEVRPLAATGPTSTSNRAPKTSAGAGEAKTSEEAA